MTEFHVHTKDPDEWGRATVECYDCIPGAEKVLANIGGDSAIDCLHQVQVDYLLTLASIHREKTGHEVTTRTFSRA